MKKYSFLVLLISLVFTPLIASANTSAQQLGVCMTDSMNGKERKNLAKWIYFGMSEHSTIKPHSNVPKADRESMDEYVGVLITRLLTEDCPKIAKVALEENGSAAFEYAFGVVGEVAMTELMAEPSVSKSLGAFERHLDQSKFDEVFK
jgi:hypothetical protein